MGLDLSTSNESFGVPNQAPPTKTPVLSSSSPGQNGNKGFGVMASLARKDGSVNLLMTLSNSSAVPLTGFAIQVNKNPFGFGPGAQLAVPDLAPGSTAEASLLMLAGQLPSKTAPTNPLFLQVAVKNSLDIFYFNVPFDLPAVLMEGGALGRDQFTTIWQRCESRQHQTTITVERPLTSDAVRSRLALDNVHYVAQRQADENTTLLYTSATTANNCSILAEVSVNSSSTSIKIVTRTETPVLVPLFEAAVSKRLGMQ